MPDIAIVGSLNMDLLIGSPHLPLPGETVIGGDLQTLPGGKGANQAVAAARLGGSVAMIGRVGSDDFGTALRRNLESAGVDTAALLTDPTAPSGVALITVDPEGQNTLVISSGANRRFNSTDVDAARHLISSARVLVAQLEIDLAAVKHALAIAREAGVRTILNPAPAQPLDPAVICLCDLLVPNEVEAFQLTGIPVKDTHSAEKAAPLLRRRGAGAVIITLGPKGALLCAENGTREFPAFPVQAVDTTAAGDAFVGALAVALAEDRPLEDAILEGCAAGALAATRPGAQPSLPNRQQVETFLASRALPVR